MGNKLSNTSINRYLSCPRSYKLRYIDNLVSESKGSPLYFGVALDLAFNALLKPEESSQTAVEIFLENWEKQKDNMNNIVELKENEQINFSLSDFDSDLLEQKDWELISSRILELGLDPSLSPLDLRQVIVERKKHLGWEELSSPERRYYNLLAWLSLKRKGLLLVKAYKEKVIPRIKEVIEIQKYVELQNGTGDVIRGYVDLIVRWEDNSIVVLDNKTSSIKYDENSVIDSQQLALYKLILNESTNDTKSGWTHKIDKAGYVVLRKNIKKEINKKCLSCNFESKVNGTHPKCYNLVNNVRCNGQWTKDIQFDVEVQFIVNEIPEHNMDKVLDTVNQVNMGITNSQFEPNYNSCKGKFGLCEYYNLCHNGSSKGLIKTKDNK